MKITDLPPALAILGAIIIAVASALPWVYLQTPEGGFTRLGLQGDGLMTIIAAAVLLIGAVFSRSDGVKRFSLSGAILSLLIGIVFSVDLFQVLSFTPEADTTVRVGAGLILGPIGALISLVGCQMRCAPAVNPVDPA